MRYTYDISINTQLGQKKGELQLDAADGHCHGLIHILSAANPVDGEITDDGRCRLTGSIRTLLHVQPFIAEGRIDGDTIRLNFSLRGRDYMMIGLSRS